MKTTKSMGRYKTFGARKEWLENFFLNPENWWKTSGSGLGSVQFEAMKLWLLDAEIIRLDRSSQELTELGKLLMNIGVDNLFTWAVIWTNLARNSGVIEWYVNNFSWGSNYNRSEIMDKMPENLSESSKKNAFADLRGMLVYTPFGEEELGLGIPIKKGKAETVISIIKKGNPDFPLGEEQLHLTVLYSLYRYAERINKYNFTVSEIYDKSALEGPYKLFGTPIYILEEMEYVLNQIIIKKYVYYNESNNEIVLNNKISSLDILKLYLVVAK